MDLCKTNLGQFENESNVAQVILEPSGDFKSDLEKFIRWPFPMPAHTEHQRLKMGMQPEPYMPDYNADPGLDELFKRTEEMLGNAWPAWQWLYDHLDDRKSKL